MGSDPASSFKAHSNYIAAFAMLFRSPYNTAITPLTPISPGDFDAFAAAVCASPSIGATPHGPPDIETLQMSLSNAWGTELLLGLGKSIAFEDELVRLTNNWAVVQAYYVAYHQIQALIVSRGQPRPVTHPATQKMCADLWADRALQLPPWTLGASRDGITNLPDEYKLDTLINPWVSADPGNCWDLAAKVLETTRHQKVLEGGLEKRKAKQREAKKAWTREESVRVEKGRKPRKVPEHFARPRLTADEKRAVNHRIYTHSLLDYLYRLRLKTNYEDASMFLDGPPDPASSHMVNRHLRFIASSTALLHELHIAALVGSTEFLGWVDAWIDRNSKGHEVGIAARRGVLSKQL